MTREEVKKMLPIMQAFADGKTIQVWANDTWQDEEYPSFGELSLFRIKPEPKYRPFKDMEECWQEMLKHQPFGWIKRNGKYVNITLVSGECSYDDSFKSFTFADGEPFGIKEE